MSESARRAAEPYIGRPFDVIPNGISLPAEFDPDGRNGNVVFIGRNEPRKGLPVLLSAWPDVHARTGARLRLVGADPLSVRWLARRQRFDLDGVDLLGGLSEDELTTELQRASLLVAPSLGGESFGMVLTRAFACALQVVASDIPGYREVTTRETTLSVPAGDPESLTQAVVAMLEDEPRRRSMGAAARVLAEEEYAWDGIARRLTGIYDLVAGETRVGVRA